MLGKVYHHQQPNKVHAQFSLTLGNTRLQIIFLEYSLPKSALYHKRKKELIDILSQNQYSRKQFLDQRKSNQFIQLFLNTLTTGTNALNTRDKFCCYSTFRKVKRTNRHQSETSSESLHSELYAEIGEDSNETSKVRLKSDL